MLTDLHSSGSISNEWARGRFPSFSGNLSRLNKRNGGGSLREGSDHHFHLQLLFDVAESIFNQLPSGLASFLLTKSYYSPLSGRR